MAYNWTYKRIGDVCTVERGGSPRPIDTFITDSDDGINWIKIGDADDSMYITKTEQKIKPEGMKKSRFVEPGDFLLSNSMSFGRPYILKIDGCIHDGWLVLRDNNGAFDKRFLYFYLSSPTTYRRFKSMAVGGVVNNLNSEMVRKVEVPIPPMNEQIEIVNILEKAQEIISARKQQLTELDNLIKARFIELFGDPLRPTHSNLLGDIAVLERGRFSPRPRNDPRYYGGDYPFIQTGDIANCGHRLSTYRQTLNERGIHVSKKFTRGTIVIAIVGATIGATAILEIDVYAPDSVIGINVDEKLYNNVFLETLLQFWQPELLRIAPESARANINLSILQNIPIVDVGLELQEQFAAFVEQTDKSKVVGLINGIMNGGVSSDSRPDGIETCPSEKCTK